MFGIRDLNFLFDFFFGNVCRFCNCRVFLCRFCYEFCGYNLKEFLILKEVSFIVVFRGILELDIVIE